MRHEAEVAQSIQRQVRERVVDHQVIDVLVGDAGLLECQRSRHLERARGVEGLHLADHRRLDALAGAEDIDRLGLEVLGAIGAGQDQGAAAVGDEAALQDAHRIGDHARVEHVGDRDRILHGRARVLRRPFALHDRHHRHLLLGDAVRLQVAQHGDREHAGRTGDAVRHFELAVEAIGADRTGRAADVRLAAFGVGDQHRLAEARFDRRRRVADVDHERAAADRGVVHPCRLDAEVMTDLLRRFDRGGKSVDVLDGEARIRNRVQRCVRVQLDLRDVGDDAEFCGFGRTDDGYLVSTHCDQPFAGTNRGRVVLSSIFSNLTCTFMSSCSASGVCGQSTTLVIMRGPSSSSTTAIE